MGSYGDEAVYEDSAVGMNAQHKVLYSYPRLHHSDYAHDYSDTKDADVEWKDAGYPWHIWSNAPHAIRWADRATAAMSW